MKQKQFKNLMAEVSSLYESYERPTVAKTKVKNDAKAESIQNRIQELKSLSEGYERRVKQESADAKYEMLKAKGIAAEEAPDSVEDADNADSEKARQVNTAAVDGKSKKDMFQTKQKDSGMDPLDVNKKKSGKMSPETPEGKGAPQGDVDEPDVMEEAFKDLASNWKRYMGEDNWMTSLGMSGLGGSKKKSSYNQLYKGPKVKSISAIGGKELDPDADSVAVNTKDTDLRTGSKLVMPPKWTTPAPAAPSAKNLSNISRVKKMAGTA